MSTVARVLGTQVLARGRRARASTPRLQKKKKDELQDTKRGYCYKKCFRESAVP